MSADQEKPRLKKQLGLGGVYAVATGATLSAGFFLLPGLAASQSGNALILAYLLAAISMIPAILSKVELATAMPKAGGMYYFLDRSLSPLVGTIGGLGTYLALVLKVAFALVGIGAYLSLFYEKIPIDYFAITLALTLGCLNLFGAKKSGKVQIVLVILILFCLTIFLAFGFREIFNVDYLGLFEPRWHVVSEDIAMIFDQKSGIDAADLPKTKSFFFSVFDEIAATAGLVFISYVGVSKVASLSEEVENPGRNLPWGVLLSFITALIIYSLGTVIMVSVLGEKMAGDLTPVASAAKIIMGNWGVYLVSFAALVAFISVANAGTLSASRYPLAMSRDYLAPLFLRRLSKSGTPVASIIITTLIIVLIIAFLNPLKIAKLASAFQLIMFGFGCLAVIVMRESRIESYDPAYKAPLYPLLQILGIIASLYLIAQMGTFSILFSTGLVILGAIWYYSYGRKRVVRQGAIYHLFERLGNRRDEGLDRELRGILKEKGLRKEDPFDEVVARSFVLDFNTSISFGEIVREASWCLKHRIDLSQKEIETKFLEGTRIGRTPVVSLGVALPHFRVEGLEHPELVLVRSKPGVQIITQDDQMQKVNALFFLISPTENPAMHLRILAQIAEHVDDPSFAENWQSANDKEELKEVVLRDEGFLILKVKRHGKSARLIGKEVRHIRLPEGTLITVIRRNNVASVASGSSILHEGDTLTIIGDPTNLKKIDGNYID